MRMCVGIHIGLSILRRVCVFVIEYVVYVDVDVVVVVDVDVDA